MGANWEAIGAVGEVGGALVVVATLLYLAAQVSEARRQLDQQSLSTTLQTIYDAWEPIYLEDNLGILRRGMEGASDLDADAALKFELFMMRILGPVLALERCDPQARDALTPFMRGFFDEEPGARAWLDRARRDPRMAPMVAAYDRLVEEHGHVERRSSRG